MTNGGHQTRTLLVPETAPDLLYVLRGSDGNIDNATTEEATARSIMKIFNVTELLATTEPIDYAAGGEISAWGLRNSVGVGEDPSTGGIVSSRQLLPTSTRREISYGDSLTYLRSGPWRTRPRRSTVTAWIYTTKTRLKK